MENLLITTIQTDLHWEEKEKNLAHFTALISAIKDKTDIIVLPEMFTTGFTMQAKKYAEPMEGNTLQWMKQVAKQKNAAVTGSFICEENGFFYNRLLWVEPDGNYCFYNKRHLFRMAKENEVYNGDSKRLIVKYKGWNIALMVCYDLRFPVWSRRTDQFDYDALIYVANWPERRNEPWKVLLQARAIENLSYVVGVNRVGMDGNGVFHTGDTSVFNYKGEKIKAALSAQQSIDTAQLSKHELTDFRSSFPAYLDADFFSIKLE